MLPFVIVCRLARTDSKSGQCSASCSVVVSLPLYYTGILNRNAIGRTINHVDAYTHKLSQSTSQSSNSIGQYNILYYITIRTYAPLSLQHPKLTLTRSLRLKL